MITIRPQQICALREDAHIRFSNELLEHVRSIAPDECAPFDETELRLRIDAAITRAGQYGIAVQRDVAHFTALTFLFGTDFDRNPDLPWASRVLRDPSIRSSRTRIEILYDYAETFARTRSSP